MTKGRDDDFDFVLVDHQEGHLDDENSDGDDDDSYDYCDDCSMLSSGSEQQMEHEDELSGSLEISSPAMGMKDSILTVPDMLMRDLDEAHAAAKLVKMDDSVDLSGIAGLVHSEPSHETSSVISEVDEGSCNGIETTTKEVDDSSRNMEHQRTKPSELSSKPDKNKMVNGGEKTICFAFSSNAFNMNGAASTSRTSNKKRRKKLKLQKKAQAAANAAQQLAEKQSENMSVASTPMTSTSKPSKAGQNVLAPKSKLRSSKKVANIAVACATETMASYRQELNLRGIK